MRGRLRNVLGYVPLRNLGLCVKRGYRAYLPLPLQNCNYDFTEQQSFTDDPITVCPECGEEQVRKVYSAVPIEFKGSGFYRTDKSK